MTLKKLFLIIVLIVSAVLVWFLSKPLAVATNGLPFQLDKPIDFNHRGEYVQISEHTLASDFEKYGIHFIPDDNLVSDYEYDDYYILYEKEENPSMIITRRVFDNMESCQNHAKLVLERINKDNGFTEIESIDGGIRNRTETVQWLCNKSLQNIGKVDEHISYYLN